MRKLTRKQAQRIRNLKKKARVIKQKGYSSGKLPKGKELHHKKAVADGGKTTAKNTTVVTKAKHKQIHKNRWAKD